MANPAPREAMASPLATRFRYLRFLKSPVVLTSILLCFWYSWFLIHSNNLLDADLGRHITNGKILVQALRAHDWGAISALLHTNFYSYSFPAFPFINHHWATGLIFYFIWKLGGFTALALMFVAVSSATLLIFYHLAAQTSRWLIASAVGFFLVPLIAERIEIRPEAFSYLLAAIFFLLLTRYRNGQSTFRALLWLPVLQILWVNLHIYFFFGPLLVGLFLCDELMQPTRRKNRLIELLLLLILVCLAGLINPSGLAGFLYPLRVFGNYGIAVGENQSILLLGTAFPNYANFSIFIQVITALIITQSLLLAKHHRHFVPAHFALMILLGTLAWTSMRNLGLLAFFALPILAHALGVILPALVPPTVSPTARRVWAGAVYLGVIFCTLALNYSRIIEAKQNFGFGLTRGEAGAAEFILNHHIAGPLFNDFDSGSYAIYYFYPRLKPFVDNRAEAYPAAFFKNIYKPFHEKEILWHKVDARYHFNAMLYTFKDRPNWQRPFVDKRLRDPAWAPVYIDTYNLVLVKRNVQNAELIARWEIPKDKLPTLKPDEK